MPEDIPFEVLVNQALAQQNQLSPTGTPQNQFVPPANMMPPGYPGSGAINAPGMTPGAVPPEIDAALLQHAYQSGAMGASRLPEAAQPYPLTREEQRIGIRAEIEPGMTPYLPLQTEAPSVSWWERTKAMNLSMTPEGMAEHFRQLGFEARTMPHDIYSERFNPTLAEIESGEGYNIAIKEPTTGQWHILDPQSLEASDFTDMAADIAVTLTSIGGANKAARLAQAARGVAAKGAQEGVEKLIERKVAGEFIKDRVKKRAIAKAARTAEIAAEPTTHMGARVGGAAVGTYPEAIRQGLSTITDMPEEGMPTRAMRGGMEVIASMGGEIADPFQGLVGLNALRRRRAIQASVKAGDVPSAYKGTPAEEGFFDEAFKEAGAPLAKETEAPPITNEQAADQAANEIVGEELAALNKRRETKGIGDPGRPVGLSRRQERILELRDKGYSEEKIHSMLKEELLIAEGGSKGDKDLMDRIAAIQKQDAADRRVSRSQGQLEGRRFTTLHAGDAPEGVPAQGTPLGRAEAGEHGYPSDWDYAGPLVSHNQINERLALIGRSLDDLDATEREMVHHIFQQEAGANIGGKVIQPTTPFRAKELVDQPFPSQLTQNPDDLGRLASIVAALNEAEGRPTGAEVDWIGRFFANLPDDASPQLRGVKEMFDQLAPGEVVVLQSLKKLTKADRDFFKIEANQTLKNLLDPAHTKVKQVIIKRAPLFKEVVEIEGALKSEEARALMAKMEWDDVVEHAADWQFDANKLLKSLDDLDGDSPAAKVFKYLADNVGKDGIEAPGMPKAPDIGGEISYDPNKVGELWAWGVGTERATSDELGPRAIRGWRSFEPESLDFVMREQTTPSQPGYTGSREVKGSTRRPAGRVEDVGPEMPGRAPQQGPAVPPSPKRAEAELAQKEATFKEFLKQTEKDLDELYEQRKALRKRADEGGADGREIVAMEKEMRRLNEEIDAKVRHVETYRLQLGDKVESDKWLKGWKYQDLTAGEKGAHREVLEKPLSRGAGLLERLRKVREAKAAKAEKAHQARQKEASEAHQAKSEARTKFEQEMEARREADADAEVERGLDTEDRRKATEQLKLKMKALEQTRKAKAAEPEVKPAAEAEGPTKTTTKKTTKKKYKTTAEGEEGHPEIKARIDEIRAEANTARSIWEEADIDQILEERGHAINAINKYSGSIDNIKLIGKAGPWETYQSALAKLDIIDEILAGRNVEAEIRDLLPAGDVDDYIAMSKKVVGEKYSQAHTEALEERLAKELSTIEADRMRAELARRKAAEAKKTTKKPAKEKDAAKAAAAEVKEYVKKVRAAAIADLKKAGYSAKDIDIAIEAFGGKQALYDGKVTSDEIVKEVMAPGIGVASSKVRSTGQAAAETVAEVDGRLYSEWGKKVDDFEAKLADDKDPMGLQGFFQAAMDSDALGGVTDKDGLITPAVMGLFERIKGRGHTKGVAIGAAEKWLERPGKVWGDSVDKLDIKKIADDVWGEAPTDPGGAPKVDTELEAAPTSDLQQQLKDLGDTDDILGFTESASGEVSFFAREGGDAERVRRIRAELDRRKAAAKVEIADAIVEAKKHSKSIGGDIEETYLTREMTRNVDFREEESLLLDRVEKALEIESAKTGMPRDVILARPFDESWHIERIAAQVGHSTPKTTADYYIDLMAVLDKIGGVPQGGIVDYVHPGSALERAGLKAGDVIFAVNGKSVGSEGLQANINLFGQPKGKRGWDGYDVGVEGQVDIRFVRKGEVYEAKGIELKAFDEYEHKEPVVRMYDEMRAEFESARTNAEEGVGKWSDGDEVEIGVQEGIDPMSAIIDARRVEIIPRRHTTFIEGAVDHELLREPRTHVGDRPWPYKKKKSLKLTFDEGRGDLVIPKGEGKFVGDAQLSVGGKRVSFPDLDFDISGKTLTDVLDMIAAPYMYPDHSNQLRTLNLLSLDDLVSLQNKVRKEYRSGEDKWVHPILRRKIKTPDNEYRNLLHHAVLELAYSTGLRRGEVAGMELGDAAKMLSDSADTPASRALKAYQAARLKKSVLDRIDDDAPLFVGIKGGKFTDKHVAEIVSGASVGKFVDGKDISAKITPHTLRHRIAAYLFDEGANVIQVKELLGHGDKGPEGNWMTEVYVGKAGRAGDREARKLLGEAADIILEGGTRNPIKTALSAGAPSRSPTWGAAKPVPGTPSKRIDDLLDRDLNIGEGDQRKGKVLLEEDINRLRSMPLLKDADGNYVVRKDNEIARYRDTAIVEWLFGTGMRPVEVFGKKVKGSYDVKGARHPLKVSDIEHMLKDDFIDKDHPAIVAIKEYLERRETKSDYLFLNKDGGPITDKGASNSLKDYYPGLQLYSFRHSHATHLLNPAQDIAAIKTAFAGKKVKPVEGAMPRAEAEPTVGAKPTDEVLDNIKDYVHHLPIDHEDALTMGKLSLDPDMQFRPGAGKGGVVAGRIEPFEKWEHIPAESMTVWVNKKGEHIVVDGHHRFDQIQRLIKEGKETNDTKVNTIVFRESEGVTKDSAKALGMYYNAFFGKGSEMDYLEVFLSGLLSKRQKDKMLKGIGLDSSQKRFAKVASAISGDGSPALIEAYREKFYRGGWGGITGEQAMGILDGVKSWKKDKFSLPEGWTEELAHKAGISMVKGKRVKNPTREQLGIFVRDAIGEDLQAAMPKETQMEFGQVLEDPGAQAKLRALENVSVAKSEILADAKAKLDIRAKGGSLKRYKDKKSFEAWKKSAVKASREALPFEEGHAEYLHVTNIIEQINRPGIEEPWLRKEILLRAGDIEGKPFGDDLFTPDFSGRHGEVSFYRVDDPKRDKFIEDYTKSASVTTDKAARARKENAARLLKKDKLADSKLDELDKLKSAAEKEGVSDALNSSKERLLEAKLELFRRIRFGEGDEAGIVTGKSGARHEYADKEDKKLGKWLTGRARTVTEQIKIHKGKVVPARPTSELVEALEGNLSEQDKRSVKDLQGRIDEAVVVSKGSKVVKQRAGRITQSTDDLIHYSIGGQMFEIRMSDYEKAIVGTGEGISPFGKVALPEGDKNIKKFAALVHHMSEVTVEGVAEGDEVLLKSNVVHRLPAGTLFGGHPKGGGKLKAQPDGTYGVREFRAAWSADPRLKGGVTLSEAKYQSGREALLPGGVESEQVTFGYTSPKSRKVAAKQKPQKAREGGPGRAFEKDDVFFAVPKQDKIRTVKRPASHLKVQSAAPDSTAKGKIREGFFDIIDELEATKGWAEMSLEDRHYAYGKKVIAAGEIENLGYSKLNDIEAEIVDRETELLFKASEETVWYDGRGELGERVKADLAAGRIPEDAAKLTETTSPSVSQMNKLSAEGSDAMMPSREDIIPYDISLAQFLEDAVAPGRKKRVRITGWAASKDTMPKKIFKAKEVKVRVSYPGFEHEVVVDLRPLIASKGKATAISMKDVYEQTWRQLMDPKYRASVAEDIAGAARVTSVEDYQRELYLDAIQRMIYEGTMPRRPNTWESRSPSFKGRAGRPAFEADPGYKYEALLSLSGDTSFEGQGLLRAVDRVKKYGRDPDGVPQRVRNEFEKKGWWLDGEKRLTDEGKRVLSVWNAQQKKFDSQMDSIWKASKAQAKANIRKRLRKEIEAGKIKPEDIQTHLKGALARVGEANLPGDKMPNVIAEAKVIHAIEKGNIDIEVGGAAQKFLWSAEENDWVAAKVVKVVQERRRDYKYPTTHYVQEKDTIADYANEIMRQAEGLPEGPERDALDRVATELVQLRDDPRIVPDGKTRPSAKRAVKPIESQAGEVFELADEYDLTGKYVLINKFEDGAYTYDVFNKYSDAQAWLAKNRQLESPAFDWDRKTRAEKVAYFEKYHFSQGFSKSEWEDLVDSGIRPDRGTERGAVGFRNIKSQIVRGEGYNMGMVRAASDEWTSGVKGISNVEAKNLQSENLWLLSRIDEYQEELALLETQMKRTGNQKAVIPTWTVKGKGKFGDEIVWTEKEHPTEQSPLYWDKYKVGRGHVLDADGNAIKGKEGRKLVAKAIKDINSDLERLVERQRKVVSMAEEITEAPVKEAKAKKPGPTGKSRHEKFDRAKPGGPVDDRPFDDGASYYMAEEGSAMVGIRSDNGERIPKVHPEVQSEMEKARYETLSVTEGAGDSKAARKVKRQAVGVLAKKMVKPYIDRITSKYWRIAPAGGRAGQVLPADSTKGHSHNPIAVFFPLKPKGKDKTRYGHPRYKDKERKFEEYRDSLIASIKAGDDSFTVTKSSERRQFEGKKNIPLEGITISHPEITDLHVATSISEEWSPGAIHAKEVLDAKYMDAADEIFEDLPKANQQAFRNWWNSSHSKTGTIGDERYGKLYFRDISDYATGEKALRKRNGDPWEFNSEIEEPIGVFSEAQVLARKDPEIEFVSPEGSALAEAEARAAPATMSQADIEAAEKEMLKEIKTPIPGKAKKAPKKKAPAKELKKDSAEPPDIDAITRELSIATGGQDNKVTKELVRAMTDFEDPINMLDGENMGVKWAKWESMTGQGRREYTRMAKERLELKIVEFVNDPEHLPWGGKLKSIADRIDKSADAGLAVAAPSVRRTLRGLLRGFQAFMPTSRLGRLGRARWRGAAAREFARSSARILNEISTEPGYARLREVFKAREGFIDVLPDSILKKVGLPPFEEEYAKSRITKLPSRVAAMIKKRFGIAIPKEYVGKSNLDIHLGLPRAGVTRYRDRPLIKESMERQRSIMERRKKEGRVLRLPKKLKRSS